MRIGRTKQPPFVEIQRSGKAFIIVLDFGQTGLSLSGLGTAALHQVRLQMQSGVEMPPDAPAGSVMVCASLATAKRAAKLVYQIAHNPPMRS